MKFPPIDLFSFVLGFCLGVIFLFVALRIRKLSPQLKANKQNRKLKTQLSGTKECERLYKTAMLRKCQKTHLASGLFPLNDIYIDLKLIGHPFYSDPEYSLENEPIAFQQFPTSFGDPDTFADLPAPLLSLEQALRGGKNIVIMNDIGSGKTTLLARYASQILEGSISSEAVTSMLPVFMDIAELDYLAGDPALLIDDVSEIMHAVNPKIHAEGLKVILHSAITRSAMVLLLDGFDALPVENFQAAIKYAGSIAVKFPQLKIVIAAGSNYAGNLFKMGFAAFSLQAPNTGHKLELIKKWTDAWSRLASKVSSIPKTNMLYSLWLINDAQSTEMLDLTQAIWTNLALDHVPEKSSNFYDYFNRLTQGIISFGMLVKAAERIAKSNFSSLARSELSDLLKVDSVVNQTQKNGQVSDRKETDSAEASGKLTISSIDEITEYLIDINILIERKDGRFAFANPALLGYLLGWSKDYVLRTDWKTVLHSPLDSTILGYAKHAADYIQGWLSDNDQYLNRNLLLAGKMMKKNKKALFNYPIYAKRILPVILDETIPISVRLKLFNYFELEPQSHSQLLEKLKNHSSPGLRQMAALGLGKLNNSQSISSLNTLLSDPDLRVRMASCLSLYRIFNEESIDLLANVIVNGKDDLCLFAGELLAFKPGQGHAMLKELSETANIIGKKAAICGLRLIDEQWANDLLEKISTTDEQWFVRDAAAHALETKWNIDHYIPGKRQSPEETSWLIKFASQEGYSVPAGVYPYELLYRLIDTGNLEQKLVSLSYIADKPNEHTLPTITALLKVENPLREEATHLFTQLVQQKMN